MSVVNSNLQASTIARSLDQTHEMLGRSLNRLSSGAKLVNPADDAAGFATSEKLDAQNLRVQAATTNVQNAVSYVQSADSFMGGITTILSRLNELGVLAGDKTKAPSDVALYQKEFSSLQDQLRSTIGGTTAEIGGTAGVSSPLGSFNGTAMFGSAAGPTISIGQSVGQEMTVPSSNLRTGAMLALIQQDSSGQYTLQASGAGAVGTLANATLQLGTQRAALGGAQSRLELSSATLQVESENLSSAVSRIRDVDVAEESTQLAKYNILVQSGTAMLAQANQTPGAVLRLLQR